jgi:hypothetical protein
MNWWERHRERLASTVRGRLWIGLSLLLSGLIALSFLAGLSDQICDYNQYRSQDECRSGPLVIVLLTKAARFIDSFNGFVTAAATALLTWITWKLASIEKDNAATTRAQLRAYVFVTQSKDHFARIDADGVLRTTLIVENSGATPAHCVGHKTRIGSRPNPLPKGTEFTFSPEAFVRRISIAPNGGSVTIPIEYKFSPSSIELLKSNDNYVWIWGRIVYADGFGVERFTNFRFFNKGSEAFAGTIATEIADGGNEFN